MSQEETNEAEENDGRNLIYRVLFEGNGKMERFVVHQRPGENIVLPDEPDAVLNIETHKTFGILLRDQASIFVKVESPTDVDGSPPTVPSRVYVFGRLEQHEREFWTRSRGEAKAIINAYRIGRRLGSEETKKQALQKLDSLLSLASGPPVRDEDE